MGNDGDITGLDPVEIGGAQWGPSIDGPATSRLRARYRGSVRPSEWDGIVETAASILGRCPNPSERSANTTGLALGKVQSGKTLSYTALIGLAIDNGYRIIVVLAGRTNPLLEQNYQRLTAGLSVDEPSVTTFRNPRPTEADVVESVIYGHGHALVVVLKHKQRLNDVTKLLSSDELRRYPTLVVDDEGDEASLNTQFRRGSKSAVYRAILTLRGALETHGYIAYTATPQANLLILGIDGLSPDFGALIPPGAGYCGGETFFGENSASYVRLVQEDDHPSEQPLGVEDSLKRATAIFLVGSAIRRLREEHAAQHSMLIHNSNLRADHARLHQTMKTLVTQWKERLALHEADAGLDELTQLLREAYDDLITTVSNAPPWALVKDALKHEIRLVEVWMVNSLPLGRDPIVTPFRLRNNILVGGNMLGRGVTIEGLAVTYITRRAKRDTNADTMEQRARWFGYKNEYLDVCRIFLTERLRDDYTELLRHEDDFWESLERNERQGIPIREWPRMLALNSTMGLRPTRSSVANFRRFRGEDWDIQRNLLEEEVGANHNVMVVDNFFSIVPGQVRSFGNVKHIVVEHCAIQTVVESLLARMWTEDTDWDSIYNAEYLSRLVLADRLDGLDVLYMSCGKERVRNPRRPTVNIMQGRSPKKKICDPSYYPGDEHIHGGRVQLQVHNIRVKRGDVDTSLVTTGLALFVPSTDPRFDLHYVTRVE